MSNSGYEIVNYRYAFLVVAITAVMLSGPLPISGEEDIGIIEHQPTNENDWLLVLFMAGDNDLGRDHPEWGNPLRMDLKEIELSMPDSGVQVLALADFYGQDNTYLYDMTRNTTRDIGSPTIPLSTVDPSWNSELDMSDPEVLTSFLTYTMGNYSAANTMFVIWDHGSGWYLSNLGPGPKTPGPDTRGFSQDVTSNGIMYLDEFRDAFIEAETGLGDLQMDLIGFDTCSMGMIEVYYQVAPWFDLAMGSEDEQPYYGYNYSFISSMGGISPMPPVELGKDVVSRFSEEYSNPGEYAYGSISLVDLDRLVDDLVPAMDTMLSHIIERMYHNEVTMNHLLHSIAGSAEQITYTESDLGDLLFRISQSSLQESIVQTSVDALAAYESMVIDSWLKPDGRNPDGTGVSIYLPKWNPHNPIIHEKYHGRTGFLDYTADTLWDDMLVEYHKPIERVRVTLNISALDIDGLLDDLLITAINPQVDAPISGGAVYLNGQERTVTGPSGSVLIEDMFPGTYLVEVYNGSHVGQSTIKVLNRPPVPSVSPTSPIVHEGETFWLDASSSSDPDGDSLTYGWDIDPGDGLNYTDSTDQSIMLQFFETGTREIGLRVSDGELNSSINIQVQVMNLPPNPRLLVPPMVMEDDYFEINATGSWDIGADNDGLEYRFLFDDVIISDWSSSSSISYRSSVSGIYSVEVQIRDPDGDVNSTSMDITVLNVLPTANFTSPSDLWEGQPGILDASLSSDSSSDISKLNYTWYDQFSDTPIGYGKQMELVRYEEGQLSIQLVVIDDDGDQGTFTRKIMVHNRAPLAVITGPGQVQEDDEVRLDANSSSDSPWDMDTLTYQWDIHDDSIVDGIDVFIVLNFSFQGDIPISLKVTDSDGNSSRTLHLISVVNRQPTPSITGPETALEDQLLVFGLGDGLDTISDVPLLSYEWEIDGLKVGDESTLEHRFTSEGEHVITVKVTDDQSALGTAEITIEIENPRPSVVIDGVPSSMDLGGEIIAYGHRSMDTVSDRDSLLFQWYLDDELIFEGEKNISFEVDAPGKHELKLRVTDDEGAYNEAVVIFNVEESSLLLKAADLLTSLTGMLILIALLVLFLLAVYQVTKKNQELPSLESKNDSFPGSDDEEEGGVDEDEDQEGIAGTSTIADEVSEDELISDTDETSIPEEEAVILPEMGEPDMGEPPDPIGAMEIPEIDDEIFDGPIEP